MGNFKPLHCADCKAEIWPRDERWLHLLPHRIDPVVFCGACVTRVPRILHPDAPLLAPAGWGPEPRARAARPGRGGSRPERSEP